MFAESDPSTIRINELSTSLGQPPSRAWNWAAAQGRTSFRCVRAQKPWNRLPQNPASKKNAPQKPASACCLSLEVASIVLEPLILNDEQLVELCAEFPRAIATPTLSYFSSSASSDILRTEHTHARGWPTCRGKVWLLNAGAARLMLGCRTAAEADESSVIPDAANLPPDPESQEGCSAMVAC